jgi:hypothetical protein
MSVSGLPVIPAIVGLVLLVLAGSFVLYFVRPARKLSSSLDDVLARLDGAAAQRKRDLTECFAADERMAAIWREYRETLHAQMAVDPQSGELRESAVRSTVPAELFFSNHAVVDGRVHSEFFKHLPGIFTGVGILGTFFGLLKGLRAFQISQDAEVVRKSLSMLLEGVSEAFFVSAAAITLAMVVTLVEKFLLNRLYGRVARVSHLIDAQYEAGAGEEYLARLVSSSEESASQTKILKDSLVADLKQILTDLTDRQIQANTQRSSELGTSIAGALTDALKGPLDQIAGAVGQVSQDQSSAVTKLLTDVLASFSQRLEDMFGGQLTGIGEMQQRTIDAMQTAVARLQDLTANMETAGKRATDAMADRLLQTLEAAEARQAAMAKQLADALETMRASSGESQEQTRAKLESMLTDLATTLGEAVARVEAQAAERSARQSEADAARAKEVSGHVRVVGEAVEGLSGHIDGLLAAVRDMTTSVESVTRDAFVRLNSGADTMLAAAGRFESSGRNAAEGLDRMTAVTQGLSEAAGSVATAARSLDSVVSDYRGARDAVGLLVGELRQTVEAASREAALTSDVLARLEASASKLADAQGQAERFLDEVVEVIAGSHEKFAEGMRSTVVQANRDFLTELSRATGLLKDAIQELEFALPSPTRQAA